MNEINDLDLLEMWEDGVFYFRLWLERIAGIPIDSDTYKYLKDEIINMECLNQFIEVFDGNIDNIEMTAKLYQSRYENTA